MKIIGVTGLSGSGTSTVAGILEEAGGFLVRADDLTRALTQKGQPAYHEIVTIFGSSILGVDGEINRKALGEIIFNDAGKKAELENILHPKVINETRNQIKQACTNFAIIDAPLLIEAGMNTMCDSCWLITASSETRIKRITARDGLTKEAAQKRLANRVGEEVLKLYADVVIQNEGTTQELREQVLLELKRIL